MFGPYRLTRRVERYVTTPTGGLAVSIGAHGLNSAADHYLPGVVAKLKSLVVPGASSKHFNYGNIAIASVGYARRSSAEHQGN